MGTAAGARAPREVTRSVLDALSKQWRARRDSNPQPSDPKSDALSIELRALVGVTLPSAMIGECRFTLKLPPCSTPCVNSAHRRYTN